MTMTRYDEVSGGNRQSVDEDVPVSLSEQAATTSLDDPPFAVQVGQHLRETRMARGLGLDVCAQKMHLPVRVLRKIEEGDYTGIDCAVYLRNYLSSYARKIGVPEDTLETWVTRLAPRHHKPPLVATGGIPRSRYLFERYTSAITYAVLTAVIVVPLVWLGLEGGLNHGLAKMQPLEPAVTGQQAQVSTRTAEHPGQASTATSSQSPSEKPLMASMAPFSALDHVDTPPAAKQPVPSAAPKPAAPAYNLRLQLSGPSWVEITEDDGTRLAYRLFPAGTDRTFHSDQPLQVSIGNAQAAQIHLDGKPVDLSPFQRDKVAHFQVVTGDAKVRVTGQ